MIPAGAWLVKSCNPKILLALGSLISASVMCLTTITITLMQFCVCYGFLFGIGMGISYLPPVACGWQWFPDNKGFVTGSILCAFGFGVFFFSFICRAIVNPENEEAELTPDGMLIFAPHIAERVPKLMFTLAGCFAFLGLVSVAFVKKNPSFLNQESEINHMQLSVREVLFEEKQFWILCIIDFFGLFSLYYMASTYKVMGMQLGGYDDEFLTWVGSIGSLANGASRAVWGCV